MKNIYIRLLVAIVLTCLTFSCSDYLDKDSRTNTNLIYEDIFRDPHRAPGFLNNAYNDLMEGFGRIGGNAMLASACDEAKHSDAGSVIQFFNSSSITSSYNPDDVWDEMYKGIRKCNVFLKEIDGIIAETNSIPRADRANFKGQAYFLRAMFHFELAKRYQNIPYVKKVLDPFNDEEIYAIPQSPFKEVIRMIVEDCDSAFSLLPESPQGNLSGADFGRPFQPAPIALKARALLYLASPLNNPTNNKEYWIEAEKAAKVLYDNRAKYGIALLSKGSYGTIFTNPYNTEIIFATSAKSRNDIEKNNYPISFQGNGFTNPTQDLVDAYPMGSTYYNDPMKGYDPENPYLKRDDRFYMTILYNDATFKDSKVESYVGAKDGLFSTTTATKTGYYLRKYLVPSISIEKNETSRRRWIYFRFAEILLNYAEARNEVLDAPDKLIHDLLNEIRSRAGLRPFRSASEYIKSQSEMREYIKKERRLEFAFEEHRYWDLRRWKDAEQVLNMNPRGVRITKTNDKYSYEYFEIEDRVFDPKFYWYPIPRYEILKYKNKGLTLQQNPGWE